MSTVTTALEALIKILEYAVISTITAAAALVVFLIVIATAFVVVNL